MKVEFFKYIDEDNFFVIITPCIAFSKENNIWSISFGWLCFSIDINI